MSVLEKIEQEIKRAMKAHDEVALSVNRLIKSAVKYKEIELRAPLDEAGLRQVLASMVKKSQESIEGFLKGGRTELAAKEEKELLIIQSYLPRALDDNALSGLIDKAISQAKASGPKDMGAVMKLLKEETAGRVDGKLLAERVRNKLSAL